MRLGIYCKVSAQEKLMYSAGNNNSLISEFASQANQALFKKFELARGLLSSQQSSC